MSYMTSLPKNPTRDQLVAWLQQTGGCGLILADRYGAEILRPAAPAPPLTAARRKVLTLRFARTASLRSAPGATGVCGATASRAA